MKKLLLSILFVLVSIPVFLHFNSSSSDFLRVHIRANSNLEIDQEVKLLVRDEVVKYIAPKVQNLDKQQAFQLIKKEQKEIQAVADLVLEREGLAYNSKASLKKEYFPMREYGGKQFESGEYDALILELGQAKGDNWWCVVYPPLCFVGGEDVGADEIIYKSKIKELFEGFRK